MNRFTTTSRALLLGVGLAIAGSPATSQAQEAIPAVLPEVLFLIEDSARMGSNWDGDSTLVGADARWSYVIDAIDQVLNNAPLGMTFGVALTADGTNDSTVTESSKGFEPLAYPGTSVSDINAALTAHLTSSNGERTFAESYASLLDNWVEEDFGTPRSWDDGPFQYSCTQLVVVIIGSNIGEGDSSPASSYMTPDPLTLGFECNDSIGEQGCFADNVANFAYTSFLAPLAGTGAVKTYSILIDSNSSSVSSEAGPYFQNIANKGSGLYYSAAVPGGIQTAIWGILTDSFSGTYSNAAVSATPAGDLLFASFFEVEAGHPLYKGHLLGGRSTQTPPRSPTAASSTAAGPTTNRGTPASSSPHAWLTRRKTTRGASTQTSSETATRRTSRWSSTPRCSRSTARRSSRAPT